MRAPQPLHILLVDGSALMRKLSRGSLDCYSIQGASTLRDAQQALRRRRFDVIVCDWTLPDGCATALLEATTGSGVLRIVHAVMPPSPAVAACADVVLRAPAWDALRAAVDDAQRRRQGAHATGHPAVQRREPRFRVRFPVLVRAGDWVRRLYTADASSHGMSVLTTEALPVGAQVRVVIPRKGAAPLEFEAEARHATAVRPALWQLGLQLRNGPAGHHSALASIVAQSSAAMRDITTPH